MSENKKNKESNNSVLGLPIGLCLGPVLGRKNTEEDQDDTEDPQ